jgi:hypothetical protein
MDPKLVSSNSATGLINLEKALKHCHSFRLLSLREAVRNKLAQVFFPAALHEVSDEELPVTDMLIASHFSVFRRFLANSASIFSAALRFRIVDGHLLLG